MILAAGRGERLRPLTDRMPKPLVEVCGKPLIEHHIENLATAGFRDVIINQGHFGGVLREAIGDGSRWGVSIHWSDEQPAALETGGGIFRALPLLGHSPFLVINGDIWTSYPLERLRAVKCDWAHLVLIPNPRHHAAGDFALDGARVRNEGPRKLTFSGISVYHPRLFNGCTPGKFSVVPLLRAAVDNHVVTGEVFSGPWGDVGTLERLQEIRLLAQDSRRGATLANMAT